MRKFTIGTCVLLTAGLVWAAAAHGAAPARPLLRDGAFLTRIDGRLIVSDPNNHGTYFFVIDSNITDGLAVLNAGTQLPLLPSAALERMLDDLAARKNDEYRISALVTRYGNKNFLFAMTAFALISRPQPPTQLPEANHPRIDAAEQPSPVNAPNDVLAVPAEVLDKLRKQKTFRPVEAPKIEPPKNDINRPDTPNSPDISPLRHTPAAAQDSMLTGRLGRIHGSHQPTWHSDWDLRFDPDAFGLALDKNTCQLLPCNELETALRLRDSQPDQIRFRAAGLVTHFRGGTYLLLQRAARLYSHQNFAR